VHENKITVKNITILLFKNSFERFRESIEIANSEYHGLLKQNIAQNEAIQKASDDFQKALDNLELELFKKRLA